MTSIPWMFLGVSPVSSRRVLSIASFVDSLWRILLVN